MLGPAASAHSRTWRSHALRYSLAVATVVFAAALRWRLAQDFGPLPPFITLYPAVLLVASIAGGGPAVLASLLAALVADYYFFPPYRSLVLASSNDLLALSIFTLTNLCLCYVAERLRRAQWVRADAQQRDLLAVTLASIGDGVILTDAHGRVRFLNDEAERLTGWKMGEAQGQPLPSVFRIVNEATRQPVENPVNKVLRLGTVVGLANHTILIARDGREIPIDDSGAPVRENDGAVRGVVLVFRDFTQQKAAEEALRQSELQFHTLADSIPNLAWWANGDGYITWYNRRWYEYTGTTPQQMEGWGWQSVHDPEMLPAVLDRWKTSIATGEPFDMEFPLRRADGQFRWFLTRVMPVKDSDGHVLRWFGTNTDVSAKREVESALRDSEQRYRELFESMDEGFALCEMVYDETGKAIDFRYLNINPAFEKLTGLTAGEVLHRRATEAIPGIESYWIERYDQVVRTGQSQRFDHQVAALNRQFEVYAYRSAPGRFCAVFMDVTDRMAAQDLLRRNEEQLRLAATAAEIGMWSWTPGTSNVTVSANWRRLFGVDDTTPVTFETWRDAIHQNDRERAVGELNAASDQQREFNVEYRVVHRDGSMRWILDRGRAWYDHQGRPAGMAGVNVDITEHKRKEQELRRLNRTLTALSHSSQAMMRALEEPPYLQEVCRIIVEDCGHAMVWIGYAQDDQDKSVLPAACAGFEEGYLETLKITWADTERGRGPTGTAIRSGQVNICRNILTDPRLAPWRQDAIQRGYSSSIALPLINDGKAFGALTIYCPQSDRFSEAETALLSDLAADLAHGIKAIRMREASLRAQQQLRDAKAAAEHANSAKDHFLAVLSHELRTPLSAVIPALATLAGRVTAQDAENLEIARRNVEMEARLIDDLLDVTRIVRGKIELDRRPIELCTIVRRAADVCMSDIDARQLHFAIEIEGQPPHWVNADHARLQQVFWNLIKNAVKFTPHGGCVGVRIGVADGCGVVVVTDSGHGIEADHLPLLFNAFEQAERSITRQFGGTVWDWGWPSARPWWNCMAEPSALSARAGAKAQPLRFAFLC